jgi:hypothetical protein
MANNKDEILHAALRLRARIRGRTSLRYHVIGGMLARAQGETPIMAR